jgi:hypothetical protein
MQPARRIGGQGAGCRQLARELADAERAKEARDQREDDRKRQRATGERGARRDRRRYRGSRRHVGDALEQHLAQPDRIPPQTRRCACNRLVGGYRLLPLAPLPTGEILLRQRRDAARR